MRRINNYKTTMMRRGTRGLIIIVSTGRRGVIRGETTRGTRTRAITRPNTSHTSD